MQLKSENIISKLWGSGICGMIFSFMSTKTTSGAS